MQLQTLLDWIAWAGIVLPLAVLAWTAWRYVTVAQSQARAKEFEQLFKAMDMIGREGGNQPSQMAAIYELRNYPKYKDVIIRMCETISVSSVSGRSAETMKRELELTAKFLGGDKNA